MPVLKMTRRWRRVAATVAAVVAVLGVGLAAEAAADQQLGIDVSKYQHKTTLNWTKVKATGVRFAFIKATEGSSVTNAYFAGDWAATGSLGIYHGAYHFARPSVGTAAKQAQYFADFVGDQKAAGDLPPVLDLEDNGGLTVAQLKLWVRNWLTTTESLTGRTPIIYVSPAFWEERMGNATGFHHYPLWVANYGVSAPRVPGGWPTWTFWQGSSTGSVTGISGSVDMDAFNGSVDGLQRMANIAATAPPTTAPPTTTPPTGTASPSAGTSPTTSTSAPTQPATSAPATTQAPPPPPVRRVSALTLRTTRAVVHGRKTLLLRGRLSSGRTAVGGRPVRILDKRPGTSAWTLVQRVTTKPNGSMQLRIRPAHTLVFKAVFAGGPLYKSVVSPWWRVTVKR